MPPSQRDRWRSSRGGSSVLWNLDVVERRLARTSLHPTHGWKVFHSAPTVVGRSKGGLGNLTKATVVTGRRKLADITPTGLMAKVTENGGISRNPTASRLSLNDRRGGEGAGEGCRNERLASHQNAGNFVRAGGQWEAEPASTIVTKKGAKGMTKCQELTKSFCLRDRSSVPKPRRDTWSSVNTLL